MYKRHKFLSHSSMLFTMNLAANILHIMGDTGNIWSIFCHVEKEYDKVWIQIDANDEPKLKLFRMAHVMTTFLSLENWEFQQLLA